MSRPENSLSKRPRTLDEIRRISLCVWKRYKEDHSNPTLVKIDKALFEAQLETEKRIALE